MVAQFNFSLFGMITAVFLVIISVLSIFYFKNKRKSRLLPPGPKGLPIIGYLPFIGKNPERQFNELASKFGPILGLQIGTRRFVILNDFETTTDVYRRDTTSDRPPHVFSTCSEHENLAGMNGISWKEHRSFFVSFLRVLFRSDESLNNLHKILNMEVTTLLSKIEKNIEKEKSFNIRNVLGEFTNNILLQSLFSIDSANNDPIIRVMAEQQKVLLNQVMPTYLTVCFPELRWILTRIMPSQRILKQTSLEVQEFIRIQIEEHKQTLDKDNPRDYLDYFLIQQSENPNNPSFSDGILNSNCQVLLAGGADTTRSSIEWMFMLLAKFPAVQKSIFEEIKEVFGLEKLPQWEDRYLTPFSIAAIFECHRWKTVVPVPALRMATQDIPVKEYVIPKGCYFSSNVWAIHNDETYWKNPSEFNPERYLNEDGKFNMNERQLAFSIGKRDCPGKKQALIEQYTVLVAVLQKYQINAPPEGISLENNDDLVAGPISPVVVFEPRI